MVQHADTVRVASTALAPIVIVFLACAAISLGCEDKRSSTDEPQQPVQATASQTPPRPTELDREVALATASLEVILRDLEAEPTSSQRRDRLTRAMEIMQPLVVNPRVDHIAFWRAVGRIGMEAESPTTAAFAFDKIERLVPDYSDDPMLLTLMAEMNVTGDASAMYEIALAYEHGDTPWGKDLDQAVRWYRKAARAGNESAEEALTRLGANW